MRRDTMFFDRQTDRPHLILNIRNWNKDLNVEDEIMKVVVETINFLWSENGESLLNKTPKIHLKR